MFVRSLLCLLVPCLKNEENSTPVTVSLPLTLLFQFSFVCVVSLIVPFQFFFDSLFVSFQLSVSFHFIVIALSFLYSFPSFVVHCQFNLSHTPVIYTMQRGWVLKIEWHATIRTSFSLNIFCIPLRYIFHWILLCGYIYIYGIHTLLLWSIFTEWPIDRF